MSETSVLKPKKQRKNPRCYAALKSPNEIYYQMASIFHAIKKDKKRTRPLPDVYTANPYKIFSG